MDSCAVARRVWPGLHSYSLGELARHFGLTHRAHDAGEDARVAGQIYLLAMEETSRGKEQPARSGSSEGASQNGE
jgi:DNA polymerase III epsilon subunit-like protein